MSAARVAADAPRLALAGAASRAAVRMLPALGLAPFDREASFRASHRASRAICEDLGLDPRVEDRTGLGPAELARGGYLFVHLDQQTLLSICLYPLVLLVPCALVVNVEFALLPVFGWMSILQGAVPIVRQRPAQAHRALARVSARLRAGESFGMSIEGKRTEDGRLSPYRKGAAVLAIASGATIVPFMTHGEYARWPRGARRITPGVVDLVAYPPLETRGLTYADRDDVVATLRALAERERRARGVGFEP
jgi:1-acyl-sn-glycerol-3-phosphate acyltransferase